MAWLLAAVAIAAGVVLLAAHSLLAIIAGVIAVGAFIASLMIGARVSRAIMREREAGYSTVYDFAGFELRDPRTLEVLRARDIPPVEPGSRSLALGIFGVKPGTVLAKRLGDE